MNKRHPFERPSEPRNDWELLRWIIVDFQLAEEYSEKLIRKDGMMTILRIYLIYIVPISIGLWLLGSLSISLLNLPASLPFLYTDQFIQDWNDYTSIGERWLFYLSKKAIFVAFGITLGLPIGLAFLRFTSPAFGLSATLCTCIAMSLAVAFSTSFGLGEFFDFNRQSVPMVSFWVSLGV